MKRPRFGLWYDFRNPPEAGRGFAALYAQILEQISLAESLGFDDIWTSEHHFIDDGYSPSLLPICAAIAARTSRVRIGTNVLLLPLHDPLRVAEDAATVDVISGGRFDLGVAVGYKVEEFRGFGVDRHKRGRMMDEAVAVIRKGWDEGEFSFAGRFYKYDHVDLMPKPVQSPCPIWIGGRSEAAIRRAGRLADGVLNLGFSQLPAFLEEWRKRGRKPDEVKLLVGPGTLRVCEDPEREWGRLGPHAFYQAQRYAQWFGAAGEPIGPVPASLAEFRSRPRSIFVTPAEAVSLIQRLLDQARSQIGDAELHVYWWSVFPGEPVASASEALALAANKVLPQLR